MEGQRLFGENDWALILGASSGFGEATSLALAQAGMNIFGVHLDRKSTLPNAERIVSQIKAMGREALFLNMNAADPAKRAEALAKIEARLQATTPPGELKVLLHSLAFGTLKPFIADTPNEEITPAQMNMTLDVMAHSLVYWVQDLVRRKLLRRGGKVFAMTSAGGQRVWPMYGAVSAAKAALESHVRQLALELAPLGITVNAVRAGVTDTPALRKIPGHEKMITVAQERNPGKRLTTPQDVAAGIVALCHPGTYWMTGNVIGIDGGEDIVG
ncbi:MAG: SDR family oxidoreductase [Nitrospinota bacterium]|nr:MAG: SDR family oxidoreductase [Nitrospinota bacterium]